MNKKRLAPLGGYDHVLNRSQLERIRLGLDWAYQKLAEAELLKNTEDQQMAVLHLRASSALISDLLSPGRSYERERERAAERAKAEEDARRAELGKTVNEAAK